MLASVEPRSFWEECRPLSASLAIIGLGRVGGLE